MGDICPIRGFREVEGFDWSTSTLEVDGAGSSLELLDMDGFLGSEIHHKIISLGVMDF